MSAELYDGVSDYRAQPAAAAGEGAPAVGGGAAARSVEEQEEKLDSFADWLEEQASSTDEEPCAEGGD